MRRWILVGLPGAAVAVGVPYAFVPPTPGVAVPFDVPAAEHPVSWLRPAFVTANGPRE